MIVKQKNSPRSIPPPDTNLSISCDTRMSSTTSLAANLELSIDAAISLTMDVCVISSSHTKTGSVKPKGAEKLGITNNFFCDRDCLVSHLKESTILLSRFLQRTLLHTKSVRRPITLSAFRFIASRSIPSRSIPFPRSIRQSD